MMNRLSAFLLILICGINAVGVSGSAYLAEEKHAEAVSVAHHSEASELTFHSKSFQSPDVLTSHDHSDSEKHSQDCGTEHKGCHQCHLGHCNFLVSSSSGIIEPNLMSAIQNVSSVSYLNVDLSGPRKPPRA